MVLQGSSDTVVFLEIKLLNLLKFKQIQANFNLQISQPDNFVNDMANRIILILVVK